MTDSLRHTIAQFVAQPHTVSPSLEQQMRTLFLDYWAVTEGARNLESSEAVIASLSTASVPGEGHDGVITGTGLWARPDDAALANGVLGHGLELDDTHEEASLHPGVVVFSALLPLATSNGSLWSDFIRAAIVGYDVMCEVGVFVGAAEIYGRGFHPTGVAGAWGATAASAALLGLSPEQTAEALSIAANLASGSLEFLGDGSWTKRLNAGHAASVGIRACALATAGFTGPNEALEGRNGFATQYGLGVPADRSLALSFGESARQTSIKLFPCCRYMHGVMDLLADYRRHNDPIDLTRIERIDAGVITAGRTLVADPPEKKTQVGTSVDAQFSMPFGAAVALAEEVISPETFTNAPQIARELSALIDKVTCVSGPELDSPYPRRWAASATLYFTDGSMVELHEDAFVGSPSNPASPETLKGKISGLIGADRAEHLTKSLERTDGSDTIRYFVNRVSHSA